VGRRLAALPPRQVRGLRLIVSFSRRMLLCFVDWASRTVGALRAVVPVISSDRGSWALLVVLTARADLAAAVMRIHDHFCR